MKELSNKQVGRPPSLTQLHNSLKLIVRVLSNYYPELLHQ